MSVNDLRIGILEGTITKDTELKHSETTHKPYVQFCIASNKSIKKNGNYEKDTVFFDLCLFGKMAEVYDVSAGTIQNARNIFGIKGWQTKGSKYHKKEWSDEERENFRKDLGGDYDVNLARKYNCSVDYVLGQRRSLGIPSFKKNSCKVIRDCKKIYSDETKKEIMKKLEELRKYNSNDLTISQREKLENELGQYSDCFLTKKYNVAITKIRNIRIQLGILPFQKQKYFDEYESENMLKDLGKMPDREAAIKYGCSTSKIFKLRKKNKVVCRYKKLH